MRVRIALEACLLTLVSGSAAFAQSPRCNATESSRQLEGQLQGLIDSIVKANPAVPGIALAVLAPRLCLTWSGASGVADRATKAPLTSQHPFRIASNTKTYTAAAILRLMEDGRLSVDDVITRHLPATSLAPLRRDGYDVDHITIRHLLTHTAGIYDYAMDSHFAPIVFAVPNHRWTRAEQVDSAMVWGAPYAPPGKVFHYTDTGYILLGEIIERLSGKSLAAAYRSLLNFDALGLSSTWLETLEPRPAGVPDLAHQYLGDSDTRGIDPSFDLYGGGGLAATTADMARFTRALFAGGVFAKPTTITLMTTLPDIADAARAYAFGMSRQELAGDTYWGHSGFWNTLAEHVPVRDVTVAAAVTQQEQYNIGRVLLRAVLERVRP
jgi:D-alanyl-D-alanine carboxypeptidase